jgi:PAS domain S-box-containing protein
MTDNTGNGTDVTTLSSERALRDFAPYPYQSLDEEGTVFTVNDAWLETLGYEREAVEGELFGEFLTADSRDLFESRFPTFKSNGSISDVEFEMIHADGNVIEVSLDGKIESDADGGFVRTHCQFHDVTERNEREQDLHRLTREYEALLENTEDVIFVTDVETTGSDLTFRFELANPSHEIISELETEEVRGKTPRDVFDKEIAAELTASYRRCVEAGESITLEETLQTPNGEMVWQLSLTPITINGDINRIIGSARDITERKERERQLERYEQLVENLPVGVYQNTAGPEGAFTLLNDAMVEMFDADSKAHLRDQSVSDLYRDSDERATFSEQLADSGTVKDEELALETLDGEEIWGAVTAIAREVDGETVFDGAIQDITERKEFEQRLKEQRDNLDVLNQVLRHDIRNDLQLVTVYAELLSEHADDQEAEEYVENILENAEHAVELTKTARTMADVMLTTAESSQERNLRLVLERTLDEIRSTYSGASITVDGSLPSVTVLADDMLDSVFRNILKNAIQHNDKSVPEVTVSVQTHEASTTVRIADNGPGVPDGQKADIFGKGEKGLDSQGTGIGLYLVNRLVDSYGGDVWVEDNDPEGAVFVVELPTVNQ